MQRRMCEFARVCVCVCVCVCRRHEIANLCVGCVVFLQFQEGMKEGRRNWPSQEKPSPRRRLRLRFTGSEHTSPVYVFVVQLTSYPSLLREKNACTSGVRLERGKPYQTITSKNHLS